MTNPVHILETALLLLGAYLLGCVVGYATRRILHAGRGTRQVPLQAVATTPVPIQPPRPRSSAARLAASVEDMPPPAVIVPQPAPVAAIARPAAKPRPKSRPAESKPPTLAEPRAGGPDNLKQIKGIGPKIEASLQQLGIFHLDQIAGWSRADVDWVDAQLSFKGRIRRERWVEQALELTRLRVSA